MIRRCIFLLPLMAGSVWSFARASAQAAAQGQTVVLRSGQVMVCRIAKGCDEEMIAGKRTYSMATDGFSVKVALHLDAKSNYADVTVTNGTATRVEINPAAFRIETTGKAVKRLSYVDGATAMNATAKVQRQQHGLPPPWYFTDPARIEERETLAAERRSTPPLLREASLAPGGTIVGRVYFEAPVRTSGRRKNPVLNRDWTDSLSLVVPIAGSLFEFPNWPVSADLAEYEAKSPSTGEQGKRPLTSQR